MTLDMVSVLFGGVTALLPVYAAEILFIGPSGLGILRAAPALGAFLMSAWLIRNEIAKKAGTKLFWSVAGFGVCILVFALSRDYILSLVALVGCGMFDSVSMIIRTSAVQLVSPDHMRGRIAAVNSIFIGSSNELGEFESGLAAKLLGTMPAAVFGGVMCLISVGVVAIFSPALRSLDLDNLKK
jgi:MFS family permease